MVVHKNWITCIKYINDLNLLLTSCVDGTIAFTDIIRGDAATRIFNGHHSARTGVKTFSYSTFGKYIVSAGDRDLLFWDAYSLEVINRIENLTAPIVAVEVSDHSNKVFAALANKIVYSWHNITYELLQEISDPTIYKPHDCLSAMAFSDELQCLFTAGSQVTSWKLQR